MSEFTAAAFKRATARAQTTTEFVAVCAQAVTHMAPFDSVRINEDALAAFATTIKAPEGEKFGWNNYISADAASGPGFMISRIFHEMACIIGQMGSFFTLKDDGSLNKWEVKGSGARAMVAKMDQVRDALGAPGWTKTTPAQVARALPLLLKDTPDAAWRKRAFMEFYSKNAPEKSLDRLVESSRGGDATGARLHHFDFATVKALAKDFPANFGNDPLYKKASLVFLTVAAHIAARNPEDHCFRITLDLPAAADYRLPQALSADGVDILSLSPVLADKLKRGTVMQENDPDVLKLRAASVVAADRLAKASGHGIDVVDATLWTAGRELEAKGKTLPPMQVLTRQF